MAGTVQKPWRKRWWVRLLVVVLVAYGAWLGLVYWAQDELIFPRSMAGRPTQDSLIPKEVERLWITASDGSRVEAWYFPAWDDARGHGPAPLAMFFHGNGELIDHSVPIADEYRERGIGVLLVEFRGYGRSGGSPSQKAIVEDACAFYDLVVKRPEVDASRVISHGHSLGSGVAAQLAAARPCAALILDSPFTSVASFAAGMGAPEFVVRSPFRTDRVVGSLACPILILHSRHDEIVPFSHGERLHAMVPSSVLVELDGGHNALCMQRGYWEAVDGLRGRLGW